MAEVDTSQKDPTKESTPPATEIKKKERTTSAQPWDDIAAKLLQEKLLLTALELHTELTEAGYELPRLRDYFSNPANFEQYAIKGFNDPHSSSAHTGPGLLRKYASHDILDYV